MVVGEINLTQRREQAHGVEKVEFDVKGVVLELPAPADGYQPEAIRHCGIKRHQFRSLELFSNDPARCGDGWQS